ncbi:unnamed protein product [Linum tenue]|uniref:Uncharacterized protein n=1 Tax=Linum tenue TaxID=586396 RepID=A0AAV0PDE5_9ROSI|nr:unnamed protein product [Linum tenue]
MAPFDFKSNKHFVASSDGVNLQVYELTKPTLTHPSSIRKTHWREVANISTSIDDEDGEDDDMVEPTEMYDGLLFFDGHGKIEGRVALTKLAQHLKLLSLMVSPGGLCFQDVNELGEYADFGIHYLRLNDLFSWPHHGVSLATTIAWGRSELKYHEPRHGQRSKQTEGGNTFTREIYERLKRLVKEKDEKLVQLKEEADDDLQNLKAKDEELRKLRKEKDEELRELSKKKNAEEEKDDELEKLRKEKDEELQKVTKEKDEELQTLRKKKNNRADSEIEGKLQKLRLEKDEEIRNLRREKDEEIEKTVNNNKAETLRKLNEKDEELRKLRQEKEDEAAKSRRTEDELRELQKKKSEKTTSYKYSDEEVEAMKKEKDDQLQKLRDQLSSTTTELTSAKQILEQYCNIPFRQNPYFDR